MVTMVWVVSISQLTCASWASHPQKSVTLWSQPGGETTKSIWTFGGIGEEKRKEKTYIIVIYPFYIRIREKKEKTELPFIHAATTTA